jgi:hypothetical protein
MGAGGAGQAVQPAIQCPGKKIGERRRGWRPLRQMRHAIEGGDGRIGARQHAGRLDRGAQARKPPRDGPGIAQATEQAMNTRQADRGEKLGQVEGNDHALAGMDLCATAAGAAGDEAVRALMHGNGVQDLVQNAPLERFQPRLGCLDQPHPPIALARKAVVIVLQWRGSRAAMPSAFIGQPVELLC